MTSYSEICKECPKCSYRYKIWHVSSCNTFGAKFYTDGYIDGEMYDDGGRILICPNCKEVMWVEDIQTIECPDKSAWDRELIFKPDFPEEDEPSLSEEELADEEVVRLPYGSFIRGQQYEVILRKNLWKTPDQEKYVRTRAWWSFNHTHRDNDQKNASFSHEHEENLLALLKLLDPGIPQLEPGFSSFYLDGLNEPIMRAEILRELGRFDECLQLLDKISTSTDGELPLVDAIKRLAMNKKKCVELYMHD